MKKAISIETAAKPGASYSQGIVANGFLFTGGFGPFEPGTGKMIGENITDQTRQTLKNLAAVLASQGLDFTDVVKVTSHLADAKRDFADYDKVYREFFIEPYPARTTVGSQLGTILVEIDLVAALRI
jgi:2-iminobutanoate/2-iminopropanoate deaminase